MPNALLGSEVRVAGAGQVWAAPKGLPSPTTCPFPHPASSTWDMSRPMVWDSPLPGERGLGRLAGDKVRVLSSREPMTLTFALQTNADSILLALGGGSFTEPSSGVFEYEPLAGENLIRTLLVDFNDGDIHYRYVIPRAQVEGDVTWTLVRTDALTYPITFGVLTNEPKYRILSDDPAMGAGSLPGSLGASGVAGAALGPAPVAGPTSDPDGQITVDSATGDVWVVTAGSYADSGITVTPVPAHVGLTSVAPTTTPPAGTWVADDVVWHDDGSATYKAFSFNGTAWAAEPASDVAK